MTFWINSHSSTESPSKSVQSARKIMRFWHNRLTSSTRRWETHAILTKRRSPWRNEQVSCLSGCLFVQYTETQMALLQSLASPSILMRLWPWEPLSEGQLCMIYYLFGEKATQDVLTWTPSCGLGVRNSGFVPFSTLRGMTCISPFWKRSVNDWKWLVHAQPSNQE